jgi:hypothetical protein
VLRLVNELSPEERKKVLKQLTTSDFTSEVQKGIDAADRGELRPAEQVFAELKERNTARMKNDV